MANSENLTWLLTLDADVGGAAKLTKSLRDAEHGLGAVDVAMSKSERAIHSSTEKAARMGETVAAAHQAGRHGAEEHAGAVEHASDAYRRHRYETEGLGKELREVRGRTMEFAEAIGLVLGFEVIKEISEKVIDLGIDILRTSAAAERLDKSLQIRFGVEGGKEAVEYAEKFAKHTEYTVKQSEGFVSEFARAGISIKEMPRYMAAASDQASMAEDHVQGMSMAVMGLTKARMTGALDIKELRAIGIGVEQLRVLPEYAKKSALELRALMKTGGEITEEQVFHIIASKGPETNNVGDLATQMAGTMGSQLDKLAELPDLYMKKFRSAKGFEELKGKFGEVLEALDPEGPAGGRIFASLERSFDSIVGMVAGIDFEKVAGEIETEIVPGIEKLTKGIASVDWVSGAKELYGIMKSTVEVVAQIARGIGIAKDVAAAMGEMTNPAQLLKAGVHHILHPIDALQEDARGEGGFSATQKAGGRLLNWLETSNHRTDEDVARDAKGPSAPILGKGAAADVADVMFAGGSNEEQRRRSAATADPSLLSVFKPEHQMSQESASRALADAERVLPKFESAGKDAADGYVKGLSSGNGAAGDAGGDMANKAIEGTAAAQDSRSPSRKFGRLGGYGADGYIGGLEDGQDDAMRAGADLAEAGMKGADSVPDRRRASGAGPADADPYGTADALAAPSLPAASASQPSGAGRKIEINMTFAISVGEGARSRDVDEVIARLKSDLPGALGPALEQLAIEAGA